MWKRRTPPRPGNPQPLPHFSASGQNTSSTRTTSTSTPPAPFLSFSSQDNVPAPSRKPLSRCPATSTFPNPAARLLSFGVLQPTVKLSLRPETLFSNSRTATPQVVPTHGPSSVPFTRCLCPANLPAWAGRPPPVRPPSMPYGMWPGPPRRLHPKPRSELLGLLISSLCNVSTEMPDEHHGPEKK